MEVKFKQGDSITIPVGCKATVKGNVVIFEPIEQKFKRADEGGDYWCLDEEMNVISDIEDGFPINTMRYNVGNYFKTEELAKEAAKQVVALLLTLKHS